MPLTHEQLAEQAADHNCQTPDCENLFDITLNLVRDNGTDRLCWPCFVPWASRVLSGLIEELAPEAAAEPGPDDQAAADLDNGPMQPPAAGDGPPPPPPESTEDILARYGRAGDSAAAGA